MKTLFYSLLVAWLGAASFAHAQTIAPEWKQAVPGWQYQFPRDHGVHRPFRTEWWYFTGLLEAKSGAIYGFQVTFFRRGLQPELPHEISRFVMADLKFAHFAISDVSKSRFLFDQKESRGAFGEAGFGEADRLAWIDDWEVRWQQEGHFEVTSRMKGASLRLTLTPAKPPVIHGENGVSQKAEGLGRATHYYSFTRLKAEGELQLNGERKPVSGEAWFDHEWGSNQLTMQQVGWNWFSLQFQDRTELMLYQMRLKDGGIDPSSSGTYIDANGTSTHLVATDFEATPENYWEVYPVAWRIKIPKLGIEAAVTTPLRRQELALGPLAYWEGLVESTVKRQGRTLSGHGYVELTGYRQPLTPLRSE